MALKLVVCSGARAAGPAPERLAGRARRVTRRFQRKLDLAELEDVDDLSKHANMVLFCHLPAAFFNFFLMLIASFTEFPHWLKHPESSLFVHFDMAFRNFPSSSFISLIALDHWLKPEYSSPLHNRERIPHTNFRLCFLSFTYMTHVESVIAAARSLIFAPARFRRTLLRLFSSVIATHELKADAAAFIFIFFAARLNSIL